MSVLEVFALGLTVNFEAAPEPSSMATAPLTPTVVAAISKQQPAPAFASSPEFQLLLACCGQSSKGERAERVREILHQPLDWERLVQLATHHRVLPHLYRALPVSTGAPASALQMVQQGYEANARQTLWLTRELLRILGHLESCGINALPYKVPVLAEILYGNVALRQFSDLDVLIHAADVAKAKAAVLELGYKTTLELTPREERAYLNSGYEYAFDSSHGQNLLEMQWQILPRFYSVGFDVDEFFDRATRVSLGGHSVRALCAEDLMLVLCVHAAKHAWMQLSWLCDVSELAQSVDWTVVRERAQRLGVQRIVAVTFVLAHRLFGTALPHPVLAQVQKDPAVEELANRILPIITQETEYDTDSMGYFRLMVDLRERWQDRLSFLWRLALTPSVGEWSAIRLPGPLFPLYRIVRLARLAARLVSSKRQTGP